MGVRLNPPMLLHSTLNSVPDAPPHHLPPPPPPSPHTPTPQESLLLGHPALEVDDVFMVDDSMFDLLESSLDNTDKEIPEEQTTDDNKKTVKKSGKSKPNKRKSFGDMEDEEEGEVTNRLKPRQKKKQKKQNKKSRKQPNKRKAGYESDSDEIIEIDINDD